MAEVDTKDSQSPGNGIPVIEPIPSKPTQLLRSQSRKDGQSKAFRPILFARRQAQQLG